MPLPKRLPPPITGFPSLVNENDRTTTAEMLLKISIDHMVKKTSTMAIHTFMSFLYTFPSQT